MHIIFPFRQIQLHPLTHTFFLTLISACLFVSSCSETKPTPDPALAFERAQWITGPQPEGTETIWQPCCWVPDSAQEEAHKLLATRTWVELNPTEATRFGYNNLEPKEGLIILLRGVEVMGGIPEDRHSGPERVEVSQKDGIVSVLQRVTRSEAKCSMLSRAALAILPEEPKDVYSQAMYATTGGVH